jgi:ubiquinone/menaquinone biosynthesis C-methylase UbiE
MSEHTDTNIQSIHFGSMDEYSKSIDFNSDKRVTLMLKELKRLLGNKNGIRILDIGVGDGYMYKDFVKEQNIFGVDISEQLVKKAMENGITATACDVEREGIPFPDKHFDIVVTGETIEHVVNSDFFLAEINRVTKNDGSLVVTYPNINTPLSWFMMMFFDLPPMYSARFRSPHVRDWTKRTMSFALEQFGYNVKKLQGASFFLPGLGMFTFLNMARFLPRLSNQVVVVAKKKSDVEYDRTKVVQV